MINGKLVSSKWFSLTFPVGKIIKSPQFKIVTDIDDEFFTFYTKYND